MPSFGWVIQNGVLRVSNKIVLPNDTYLAGRNAANTADVDLIKVNSTGGIDFGAQPANFGTMTGSSMVFTGSCTLGSAGMLIWSSRARMGSPADGIVQIENAAATIGSKLKVDALPTIASGFGTTPSITAGSTPLAGSVNVGTGGVATSGVINFNGTSFSTAPFPIVMNQTTGAVVRATATATQLTITAPAAFTASDVISWICIGPRT